MTAAPLGANSSDPAGTDGLPYPGQELVEDVASGCTRPGAGGLRRPLRSRFVDGVRHVVVGRRVDRLRMACKQAVLVAADHEPRPFSNERIVDADRICFAIHDVHGVREILLNLERQPRPAVELDGLPRFYALRAGLLAPDKRFQPDDPEWSTLPIRGDRDRE